MEDRKKVNSLQLYLLWKNLSISLAVMLGVVAMTRLLPFFLAPAVSLAGAAVLYTMLFNNRSRKSPSCMLMVYAAFYCLILYTFVSIILNVLFAWGVMLLPHELIFFNEPYIPALILAPCSFVSVGIMYLRRHRLQVCVDCKLRNGTPEERGLFGRILNFETSFQLVNFMVLFGGLTAVIWTYYLVFYININQNSRDWFVFVWIVIISFLLDEIYFIIRYYNLYLDLKEANEIITPEELQDMTAKTYLRFYVVCGNKLYVDPHSTDPAMPFKEVYDTPFETRRTVNGMTIPEVQGVAERMTGEPGELRFFFGRRIPDLDNHSLLRYFYFLDGDGDSCPARLNSDGQWMDFDEIKAMYSKAPGDMSRLFMNDLTRLATIVLTEKTFDERGYRRSRIKSYQPGFTLGDVRHSDLDFQDDKWIRISMFNADMRFYGLKKWWRDFTGSGHRYNSGT